MTLARSVQAGDQPKRDRGVVLAAGNLFKTLASGCDGHHKKFDLGAVSERAHKGAKSVTPVCHHPRLDGPFAGLMETPNEQGQ